MFDRKNFSGKIFIDMDGTLNYHQTRVREYLESWLNCKFEQDIRDIKWFQDIIPFKSPELREYTMFKIYSKPEFWLSLKPDTRAASTIKSWLDNGYKIVILTSTPPKENISEATLNFLGGESYFEQIADSKMKWLEQQFPKIDWRNNPNIEFKCVRTLDKFKFLEENSIVIDDKSPYGGMTAADPDRYHKNCYWIRIGLENRRNDLKYLPDIQLSHWNRAKKTVSHILREDK